MGKEELQEAQPSENCHYVACLAVQDLCLFDLTQSSLCVNTPTHRAVVENKQRQLFNITTVWGSIIPCREQEPDQNISKEKQQW